MNLYLVRHADAQTGSDDARRHLSDQGWTDARRLGEALRAMKLAVREVWHSDMDRAVETARAVTAAMPGEPMLKVQQGLRPEDRTRPMGRLIRSFDGDLMIVGHEPFLGKLAARLVAGKPSRSLLRLDKPSCVCLTNTEDGEWRVAWMLARPMLPAVACDGDGARTSAAPHAVSDGSDDNTP